MNVRQSHVQAGWPRAIAQGATGAPETVALRSVTSEELVAILVRSGGRIIARPLSAALIEVRRRLVLVPVARFVSDSVLVDALRAAAISPARFRELLAEH